MRRVLPWLLAGVLVVVIGCGPVTRPLPERLNDDDQKKVDEAWDAALTPVGKHDHQMWLDVMVGTYAYQAGVDQFEFRSVKRWSGGTVVMEARFDRATPDADQFTMTVRDHAGQPLRIERYSREDVKQTVQALTPPHVPDDHPAMQAYQARVERIAAILPQPKDDPAK